jgi:hypothetical protein
VLALWAAGGALLAAVGGLLAAGGGLVPRDAQVVKERLGHASISTTKPHQTLIWTGRASCCGCVACCGSSFPPPCTPSKT